ncbi:putative oxidoreductase MhqP [Mycolicibacterium chubuense]|uniref:Putative oxidoreductase MhqP n=2 Tax=Mycolicibacterium chubuense TaxID=1800 RepID=A0A0J6WRD0_MYCCU|nr:putative oxidoreductase MhqP [Mycolicibacterium chubuense]
MTAYDVGVLILRVVLGLTMAAHGYNKFFGKGGLAGTAGWFDSMGMKPGMFHARIAATTEMAAGGAVGVGCHAGDRGCPQRCLGLAVGLLTPIPAAGFVALMLVAAWTVHKPNGFFIVKEGWEYNLVLAASAVGIATIGAGRISLDYALFSGTGFYDFLHGWWGLLIALVLGLAGGIGQLVIFYRPPAKTGA